MISSNPYNDGTPILYRCFLGIIVNYHPFYGRFDILPGIQVDNFYIKGGSLFLRIYFLNEG
jgi:hypothetical protein